MKRNFKKIALAASFAAFGCNSFVNASLTDNAFKIGAILVLGKGASDTLGLGDYVELQLLLKDKEYTRRGSELVPLIFKDEKGEAVKPSKELQGLVKTAEGKWIGDATVDINNLTLWQLVKNAVKNGSREQYKGEALKKIMSEVYEAMSKHKRINLEINKNLKIVKTLPEITIKE